MIFFPVKRLIIQFFMERLHKDFSMAVCCISQYGKTLGSQGRWIRAADKKKTWKTSRLAYIQGSAQTNVRRTKAEKAISWFLAFLTQNLQNWLRYDPRGASKKKNTPSIRVESYCQAADGCLAGAREWRVFKIIRWDWIQCYCHCAQYGHIAIEMLLAC